MTVDAIAMATAALLDAVVVRADIEDFERLGARFPAVTVLAA